MKKEHVFLTGFMGAGKTFNSAERANRKCRASVRVDTTRSARTRHNAS